MEDVSASFDLEKSQGVRRKTLKQRPPLSLAPKQPKLQFSDASTSSSQASKTVLQTNSVLLQYNPFTEYQRSARIIKHSTDRFIVDTDYPEHGSLGSNISSNVGKRRQPKFPEPAPLNPSISPAIGKRTSNGRMHRITLAKLDHFIGRADQRGGGIAHGLDNDSLSLSLTSMQSKSVDDLFSTVFSEREGTKKELTDELCFTSKVATPRLVRYDPDAHFKSKDLLNSLIEDVSSEYLSIMNTNIM